MIGDRVVTVSASDSTGTLHGSTTFPFSAGSNLMVWNKPLGSAGREIMDAGGTVLLYVEYVICQLVEDPAVALNFAVAAGASGADITITSPAVSFGALTDPDAYASAGMTVTDSGSGATVTGQHPGAKAYQAAYNGTPWVNLIDTFSIPGYGTGVAGDRSPAAGWATISDDVSSIAASYKFQLTANSYASGTSRFEVVPEPATLGFMGLGLAALFLRRRLR